MGLSVLPVGPPLCAAGSRGPEGRLTSHTQMNSCSLHTGNLSCAHCPCAFLTPPLSVEPESLPLHLVNN